MNKLIVRCSPPPQGHSAGTNCAEPLVVTLNISLCYVPIKSLIAPQSGSARGPAPGPSPGPSPRGDLSPRGPRIPSFAWMNPFFFLFFLRTRNGPRPFVRCCVSMASISGAGGTRQEFPKGFFPPLFTHVRDLIIEVMDKCVKRCEKHRHASWNL